jgi:uncharacterized membrane protein
MKGTLLFILVISMLIVGVLFMRNTESHKSETNKNKIEAVQKAEDVAKQAAKNVGVSDKAKDATEEKAKDSTE